MAQSKCNICGDNIRQKSGSRISEHRGQLEWTSVTRDNPVYSPYDLPDYPQKEEDLIDCYGYLLDYYEVDNEDELGPEDFDYDYELRPLDEIEEEVHQLKVLYQSIPEDRERVEKIRKAISGEFPVYVHEGEIIAGTHRSVAYLLEEFEVIPIVRISLNE